jgi:hypothetical protein
VSYALAFSLQLRKKHGKLSVRVAARTSQADTIQYKNNVQYNTQNKNSTTKYYNVTEHRIHNIEYTTEKTEYTTDIIKTTKG